MSDGKDTKSVTVYMDSEFKRRVRSEAGDKDMSMAKWFRHVAEKELNESGDTPLQAPDC